MEDDAQARKAIEALQGKILDKCPLNIKIVKEENESKSGHK